MDDTLLKKWGISQDGEDIYVEGRSLLESVQTYYEKFGKVVAISIYDKHVPSVGFGYVVTELEDGQFAEIGILRCEQLGRPIIIPGEPLYHDISRKWFKIKYPNDSPSNILNALNNDCLMEVFQRLSLEDLCAVSDTCTRFRDNAKKIFPIIFPTLEKKVRLPRFPQIESLLRNFGKSITSFSIDFEIFYRNRKSMSSSIFGRGYHHNALALLLATYCSDENCHLKSLQIKEAKKCTKNAAVNIDMGWFPILEPVFTRFNRLYLERCDFGEMLNFCDGLNELYLRNSPGTIETLIKKRFEHLHKLTLFDRKGIVGKMPPSDILKCLEVIDAGDEYDPNVYENIHNIGASFSNLEELTYKSNHCLFFLTPEEDRLPGAFIGFKNLQKLVLVRIECTNDLVDELVKTQPKLKSLFFHWLFLQRKEDSDRFVATISNFKDLDTFEVWGSYHELEPSVHALADALPQVKKLVVNGHRYMVK